MRTWARDGLPHRVEVDGRVRAVRYVLDAWRVGDRWWRGEAPSDHWLLELEDGAILELRERDGVWELAGTLD